MQKLRLHYGDFVQANFNKTADQLELVLRVSKAIDSEKTLEQELLLTQVTIFQCRCHRFESFSIASFV